jgi:hypothetical protein
MFPAGEVNWKAKLTANGNKANRDICAWDRARNPCLKKEQDCLKSHMNGIVLAAHYLEAFVKIFIDALDDHWVAICT